MVSEEKVADLLRETLEKVEKYELPEQFGESPRTTASLVDGSLIKQYASARDEYVQSQIANKFAHQLATYDGEKFEVPSLPNLEEKEARKEAAMQSLRKMQRLASEANVKWEELYQDHLRLEERKKHLRRLLKAFEEDHGESFCGGILEENKNEDEAQEYVSEDELQKEEQRLLDLKMQKKRLLSKLHQVQAETLQMELETTEAEASLGIVSSDDAAVAEIEQENKELVQKIGEHKQVAEEMCLWKTNLETITDFKIKEVDIIPGKVVVDPNPDSYLERDYHVKFSVEVLDNDKNHLEIYFQHLKGRPYLEDEVKVVHAKFIKPKSIPTHFVGQPGDNKLDIVVGDLIPLSNQSSKSLSTFIHETIRRILTTEKRVEALCRLDANKPYPMEIGKPEIVQNYEYNPHAGYTVDQNFGRFDIEVRISLTEYDVKVMICLPPDGFVNVSKISTIDGKESEDLEEIREKSNERWKLHKGLDVLLLDLKTILDSRK